MSDLSEVVGEGGEVDQTEANFNIISNIIANVTRFITESNAMINEVVSIHEPKNKYMLKINDSSHVDCCKCDTNSKLAFAMGAISN